MPTPNVFATLPLHEGGHEQQIEVAKLADDNPLKPVLRELFALYGEMTEKLRDGELDVGEVVKAMQALEGAVRTIAGL